MMIWMICTRRGGWTSVSTKPVSDKEEVSNNSLNQLLKQDTFDNRTQGHRVLDIFFFPRMQSIVI
ncbi:hypothetical protein HanPSC8_Chr11g0450701 [Helianthus annuus]|nr:hypothetical protein HanPSC8_Chr11g0450701 [Helianthus annuus]